ncbi:hypothetical protein OE88DRAFT_1665984 [Heliocybe sulcata]|uniref:Uncharacterized protein n=1 Tax=Heliocybe sulcata TaxID=5364 RepID=A0A5C3MQW9_9AGAM|nr:hypothetical protein OE88DRAFT_1665984 [Heliocybe sulcata]
MTNLTTFAMTGDKDTDLGSGSGSSLSPVLLTVSGISTLVATVISVMSITLQLKNYRKPILQRFALMSFLA